MEQTTTTATATRPGFLSTLCILSFIGSGLGMLFGLIGMFASGWVISLLGGASSAAMDQAVANGEMTADQAEKASQAAGMLGTMGAGLFIAIFGIVFLFNGLSFWGALKMWGLKKGGFWLYTIPTAIVAILALIGGSYFAGIVCVAFIAMYAMNLKHMNA